LQLQSQQYGMVGAKRPLQRAHQLTDLDLQPAIGKIGQFRGSRSPAISASLLAREDLPNV
jgi:hypothetical protein